MFLSNFGDLITKLFRGFAADLNKPTDTQVLSSLGSARLVQLRYGLRVRLLALTHMYACMIDRVKVLSGVQSLTLTMLMSLTRTLTLRTLHPVSHPAPLLLTFMHMLVCAKVMHAQLETVHTYLCARKLWQRVSSRIRSSSQMDHFICMLHIVYCVFGQFN